MSGVIGIAALAIGTLTTGVAQAALVWLGLMNLILMVFNLLPAFPLDGGRIYHAWLWDKGGDELAATNRAVEIGQRVGAVRVGRGLGPGGARPAGGRYLDEGHRLVPP